MDMETRTALTAQEVHSLPQYADVRIRRAGGKRAQAACITGVRDIDGGYTLVTFSYTFLDRGERVLHSEAHVAVLGSKYPDEIFAL